MKSTPIRTQDRKTAARPSNRLILTLQGKGSVGKSTFLAALVEWAKHCSEAPRIAVFDPDNVHRTLSLIFGENGATPLGSPHTVKAIDWRGDFGSVVLDDLVRSLAPDGSADVAILDGVANQADDVLRWLSDVKLFDQAALYNFGITVIIPVDETTDSAKEATKILKVIGGRTDVVIVRVQKVRQQLPWDATLAEASVGGDLEIPLLHSLTIERFQPDVSGYMAGAGTELPHSLWEATQQQLNTMLRARAQSYWERLVPQFEQLAPVLLPVSAEVATP